MSITPEQYKTIHKAIEVYGVDHQLKLVLEEMAELQKEICKNWRGRDNVDEIADECADVEITLAQLKIIFGIEGEVERHRTMKINRLKLRLRNHS